MMARGQFRIEPNWRGRGLALLRFVLFIAAFVALNLAANSLLAGIQKRIALLEGHFLLAMAALGVVVILLTMIMARISGRAFFDYGLNRRHVFAYALAGIGVGMALIAAQLGVLTSLGYVDWAPAAPHQHHLLWFGVFYAALFLIVAVTEETLFRGYALVELTRAISFWPACILLGALFGAMHAFKGGGENLLGGLQAMTIGTAFALSFRATGSLWFAIGCHAGWNYAESFIFGMRNSAILPTAHVLSPVLHGPVWITGGAVGPEGGVFAIAASLALAAAWRLCPGWRVDSDDFDQPI
jgi:membrane protease YdiL (CAAX protease family)